MSIFGKNVNQNAEEADSQNKRIVEYLRAGNTITSLESWLLIECGHLASRIDDLHKQGVPVLSVNVTREKVEDPESGAILKKKKSFSAYYLYEGIKKRFSLKDEDIPEFVKQFTEERINKK